MCLYPCDRPSCDATQLQKHLQNCSSCEMLSVCSVQDLSKGSKYGTVVNQRQGYGWPSLSHAQLSRSYSHMYFIWLLLTFVILVSRAYLHLSSFSSSSSQITASSANIIVPSYPTSSVNLLITTANKGGLKTDPCNLMSTLNTSLTPTAHLTTVLLSSYFPGTPDFLLQYQSASLTLLYVFFRCIKRPLYLQHRPASANSKQTSHL